MRVLILLLVIGSVNAEHLADYVSDCGNLDVRKSVILFTDRNTNGKLAIIMNGIADSIRAMNYRPIISYDTCGVEISLKPSFIQFNEEGNIIRLLDPSNPPPQIKTDADIFGYFVESLLSSRVNRATRVDFGKRSSLIYVHDLEKHTEFIVAVLPKRGYSRALAEYVEWVQSQEYGIFEFQYMQENLDDKTSSFLRVIGHAQSIFTRAHTTDSAYYHIHRIGTRISSRKYDTLAELDQDVSCIYLCIGQVCKHKERSKCHENTERKINCKTDYDCTNIGWTDL